MKSVAGAYLSMEGFKRLIVDSVKEFIAAEQAETKLSTALRLTGQYSREALDSLKQFSAALQMHTVFEDDATNAAAAMLLQIGHLTTDGVQKAIPVLMDYASAMGIDLTTAATQFAQAIEGGRNVFQRYGISLKDAQDPTSRFNVLIAGLSKNFNGMADAIGRSTGGQLQEFKNQIKDIQENVGGFLASIFTPALRLVNEGLAAKHIMGMSIANITDIGTLKSYQASLVEFLKTLQSSTGMFLTVNTQGQIKQVEASLAAITQQIQRLSKAGGKNGAVVTSALGEDPEAGLKQLFVAWSAISAMYGTGMTNATAWKNASMGTGAPAIPGTGSEYPGGTPATSQGTPGTGSESPGAYQLPAEWIRQQKEELRELEKQWRDVGEAVVSFGQAIGAALVSGDWEGAIRSMIVQISNLIAQYAIAAAAAAAVAFNWPMVAFWLGVAGLAAIGGGIVGAGGLSGGGQYSDSNLPHYASGTDYVPRTGLAVVHQGESIIPAGGRGGGGNTNIYVYGGVWQSDQLARQISGAVRKW